LILTIDQQIRIRQKVQSIESKVFGELLVVVSDKSTPIFWISWVLPAVFSWVGFSVGLMVYQSSMVVLMGSFFLGAMIGLGLSKVYWVQKIMIPNWIEQRFVQREALHYFYSNRVSQTPSKSGVLLFVSLFERELDIIVDSALKAKVTQEQLNQVVNSGISKFKQKNYCDGVLAALDEVEMLLTAHFVKPEQKNNELHEELILVSSPWD
jgi:putative membrane protein